MKWDEVGSKKMTWWDWWAKFTGDCMAAEVRMVSEIKMWRCVWTRFIGDGMREGVQRLSEMNRWQYEWARCVDEGSCERDNAGTEIKTWGCRRARVLVIVLWSEMWLAGGWRCNGVSEEEVLAMEKFKRSGWRMRSGREDMCIGNHFWWYCWGGGQVGEGNEDIWCKGATNIDYDVVEGVRIVSGMEH